MSIGCAAAVHARLEDLVASCRTAGEFNFYYFFRKDSSQIGTYGACFYTLAADVLFTHSTYHYYDLLWARFFGYSCLLNITLSRYTSVEMSYLQSHNMNILHVMCAHGFMELSGNRKLLKVLSVSKRMLRGNNVMLHSRAAR